jgi:hypothetical protein
MTLLRQLRRLLQLDLETSLGTTTLRRQETKFQAVVGPSGVSQTGGSTPGIESAGLGVRISTAPRGGSVPSGTVVAIYPGVARLHAPVLALVGAESGVVLPALGETRFGQDYVANRFWGSVDGSPELLESIIFPGSFAVGNRINHPPAGTPPNVALRDAFVVNEALGDAGVHADLVPRLSVPPEVFAALPVRWAAPWRYQLADGTRGDLDRRTPLPVPFFETTREVEDGEELFFDYNLQVRPEWYTPVRRPGVLERLLGR